MAKYKYEFDRDVVVDIARNSKSGIKYSADRYIRFTEEKLKSKEALIEKLRLKNAKMSDRNRKISHQRKEEMGEVLHEVDFNYLKIENKQYLEKIDDKNLEFTKLKLQTGETERHLNQYKESLARLVNRAEELQPEIEMKNDMLSSLRDEISEGM
jgi:chromosome segregation ATPase